MVIDKDVLRAAVIGLLIEEGHEHEVILNDWPEGQCKLLPDYVEKAMRKVGSVALTFQAHGIIREATN